MFLTTLFYKLFLAVDFGDYQSFRDYYLSEILGRNILRISKEEEACILRDLSLLE